MRIKQIEDIKVEKYCCSIIKERIQDGSSLLFQLKGNGISLYDQWSSSATLNRVNSFLPIKYCPFCGEKIEIYKEKEKRDR